VAVKTVPRIRLVVHPLDTSSETRFRPYAVVDNLSKMGRPDHDDKGATTRVKNVSGLRWWDMPDPQAGQHLAGYTLEPQIHTLHSAFAEDLPQADDTDAERTGPAPVPLIPWAYAAASSNSADDDEVAIPDDTIIWDGLKGDYWTTVVPDYEPGTAAIKWYCSDPDAPQFHARSTSMVPAAQDLAFQLHPFGYVCDDAQITIQWGDGYGVRLQAGEPMRFIQKKRDTVTYLREFPVAPDEFFAGEPVWIKVHHIGGRAVLTVDHGKTSAQVVYGKVVRLRNPSDTRANETLEMDPVLPKSAYLQVYGHGIPFTLRTHEIDYDADGYFEREYQPLSPTGNHADGAAFGYRPYLRPDSAGVAKSEAFSSIDTAADGSPTFEEYGSSKATDISATGYRCTLERTTAPAPSGTTPFSGHCTPLVKGVCINYPAIRMRSRPVGLDLTPAVRHVSMTSQDPMLAPGETVTARLHRSLLPSCPLVDADLVPTGSMVGENWPDYLAKYHDAQFAVAWDYDDGTTKVVRPVYETTATWGKLFDGCVWRVNPAKPEYGKEITEVEFRDPIVRLQRPAGVIDSRFCSGDILLAQKMTSGKRPVLYGWELVKYIVEVVLGAEWASKMVVGDTMKNENPDLPHWDLLTYEMLAKPPHGPGFFFPPPWGQSALDWIQQIADADFGTFCFGLHPDYPFGPAVPIYAHYQADLQSHADAIRIPDTQYDGYGNDVDGLLEGLRTQQRPHVDYNCVVVWGHPPQGDVDRDIMPALPQVSGVAWIIDNDDLPEQLPQYTWERTLVKQGTQFWMPPVARVVALGIAALLRGVDPRNIPVTIRGEPLIHYGDKVRFAMTSTHSEALVDADEEFRVMRVEHDIDMDAKTWKTDLSCAPRLTLNGR